MIEDMKKYTEDLSGSGRIVEENLRNYLKPIRELMVRLKSENFADNAILHGIWMLLAAHTTYIICRTNNKVDKPFIDEISRKTQLELGKAIEKLLKENAGNNTMVAFMEVPKKEEGTNEQKG